MYVTIARHIKLNQAPDPIGLALAYPTLNGAALWAWCWLVGYAHARRLRSFDWLEVSFAQQARVKVEDLNAMAEAMTKDGTMVFTEDMPVIGVARSNRPVVSEDPHPAFVGETWGWLEMVPRKVQDAWLETYKDSEWVKNELKKAHLWCIANPQKAPKAHWARFLTGWLGRAHEWHRRQTPTRYAGRSEATPINVKPLRFEDL